MKKDYRNRLLRYSKDIGELAEEVRLCQHDLQSQSEGTVIHYAVDTNILFFGVSPHRRADLGHVFFDDRLEDARTLALSLRRFLFERLCSFERPFLISHGHDAEARWAFETMLLRGVHEQIELEEELNDISEDFAFALSMANEPAELLEQALPKLANLLAHDDGPGQDYRRFAEIVETGRVQRLGLAFSTAPYFSELFKKEPELYGKFSVPRTLRDQISETRYRVDWGKVFETQGVSKNQYAMRCDVSALARIQLINERLSGTGHKVVLITADAALITTSKCVEIGPDKTFRDEFIRHPKAFLAAQSVLAPDQEAKGEELSVSNTVRLLDGWIKLLSDMMPALEEIETGGSKTKGDSEDFEALASKIKAGWRDHVAKLEEAHAASSNKYKRMIQGISEAGDETAVLKAMRDVARKKVAEVHSSWSEFFEQVLSTSYFVFDQAKLPIRPRSVPAIYFGRFHNAYDTIKRIAGDPKEKVSLDDIRALEGQDDGGYSYCLSFASLFASLGKWQTAELIADQALLRRSSETATTEDLSGRESYYVKSIAQRLQAKTPAQLTGARTSLQQSEACLDGEKNRASREWLRVRFRSEEAAIELAEVFLETQADEKPKKAELKRRILEISDKIAAALGQTHTIPDDWIRYQVTESLLTNLFIGATVLKNRGVKDSELTDKVNKITPVYAEYITSSADFEGGCRSFLGRAYFLFGKATYFPTTDADKRRFEGELTELERLYQDFKLLKVMPYDDDRFEQLFELVRKTIGESKKKT
ncbi:hypothetical protein [Thalassococcus lentus]|uniref:PIN like domain-containing protein n=1 Tax=Thalassococcus lentus TaxID=1210524 RepID=A0ABT4XUF4_9RHOB|nr:hypothetical protein [Thalassococcus lentus]MDA7425599.1 hypothetical protein [Thalassococcus lentus]